MAADETAPGVPKASASGDPGAEQGPAVTHWVVEEGIVRPLIRRPDRRRPRRRWYVAAIIAVASVCVLWQLHANDPTTPHGDPDPGHLLMHALKPVLSAVPATAHVTLRQENEPTWDSCDGDPSTYGWDDVTVDAEFTRGGLTDKAVLAHISDVLKAQGWVRGVGSGDGAWFWHRQLFPGHPATVQLLGGAQTEPPSWSLQADATPAARAAKGC